MRHLAFVVSMALLVAPAAAGADVAAGHWIGDDTIDQEAARERVRRVRPEMRTPPVREDQASPAPNPPPAPPQGSVAAPVIAADGAVETVLPNGSMKRARPGDCGWTIVQPDGRKNSIACIHVPKANLPVPDDASAAWLVSHGDSLLEIARTLLGGNAASIDNYLKSVESEQPGVYERIRLRTDLITKLTQ